MNIGIFVTSLNPKGASQARLQNSLFTGLRRLSSQRYHFIVLSSEVPKGFVNNESFTYVAIESEGRWTRGAHVLTAKMAKLLLLGCRLCLMGGSRPAQHLRRWINSEPRYYRQLRDLNVRLIWNMNQHELPTSLPFIRTIWDVNHRIHSMYPEYSYSRFTFDGLDRNMAASLARASYVICGTDEGRRQIISIFGVHERKVRVIPFPTPILPIGAMGSIQSSGTATRSPYILYPARFWPHKNHVVIIAALKILRDRWNIRLKGVFAGADEGNLEHVFQFAESLGVREQVEHVGVVSDEDLIALYKEAFALVYASAVGPDNLPPLEAMALGCPVITSEVPGAREQYGDAALYFDPMNEHELADRIKELVENQMLREQQIRQGKGKAARWSVEDYAAEVVSILDEFALIARSWDSGHAVFT